MTKHIGILTSGGDSPGLNAAIRGVGKAALDLKMHIVGFRDGFRGLMENRTTPLEGGQLSGILTLGGTILGTSREKPHKMLVDGKLCDMTEVIVDNYKANHLDCLVCLGGGGTQKNALRLKQAGLNVVTLPKTIDNDVAMTDTTFGFDTALGIATDAIDRLHSTAHSHHRIIVVEIMGHRAGWLALGAGIAGGADVILIPEIPYDIKSVADAIHKRKRSGKPFSIVAVAEGAISVEEYQALQAAPAATKGKKPKLTEAKEIVYADRTIRVAQQLEALTGLEARVTILGHLQRGGTPSAADRILATRLGTAAAQLIHDGHFGVMVAARGENTVPVVLEDVAGQVKTVPVDHSWVESARRVGTNFGD
ncbi:MAG: ATP-dependent 6-phosphofructokinase [Hydrogenophilaceae bacterium]